MVRILMLSAMLAMSLNGCTAEPTTDDVPREQSSQRPATAEEIAIFRGFLASRKKEASGSEATTQLKGKADTVVCCDLGGIQKYCGAPADDGHEDIIVHFDFDNNAASLNSLKLPPCVPPPGQ